MILNPASLQTVKQPSGHECFNAKSIEFLHVANTKQPTAAPPAVRAKHFQQSMIDVYSNESSITPWAM